MNDYIIFELTEMVKHHQEAIAQIRFEHEHPEKFHYGVQPMERIVWHTKRINELLLELTNELAKA